MTYNQRLRITIMQRRKQLPQSTFLSLSACVLGSLGVGSQAADVANADRMGVVVLAFLFEQQFSAINQQFKK